MAPITTGDYDPANVDLSFDFTSISSPAAGQQGQGGSSLIPPEIYGAASSPTMPAPMLPVSETDMYFSDVQSS